MDTRFNQTKLKKLQIFNGSQLKYLAFASMLIDHVNNALITPYLNGQGFLLYLSNLFSILGRIAFPLFVFFLVEGFFKTSNRMKYLIMLLIFGVISEVPFDLFTSKTCFSPYWNNIMFTLALCLVTIWIIDILKDKISNKYPWYALSILIVAFFGFLSMELSLDYDYHAIIVAYLFYIFYDKPLLGAGLGYISIIKELYSFIGFGMTLTYNGERGKQYKWLNYFFYPVHILILGLLRIYLNIQFILDGMRWLFDAKTAKEVLEGRQSENAVKGKDYENYRFKIIRLSNPRKKKRIKLYTSIFV